MDTMELGAIGELVGGVAVIASLIYVGLQVRQGNEIETAESIRSTTNTYVATILQVDAPLFRRAVIDFERLPGDEQMKIHNYLVAMFLIAQTEVRLSDRGFGVVSDYPPVLASLTRAPGIQDWWRRVGPTFSPDFHLYIEGLADSLRDQPLVHEVLPWFAGDTRESGGA